MAKTKIQRLQPTLAEVLAALRARLPELRERYGIRSLGVFGSYVRGEQGRGSDVDVLVEFEEEARPSLLDLVRLQDEVSGALGVKVDLGEKKRLKPFIGRRVLLEVVWLMGGDKGAGQPPTGAAPDRERGGMAREYLDFLRDMVEAMREVEQFVRGMSFDEFASDRKTLLAVTKAVEIVGEAAKRVPEGVRRRYPHIPWKDMAGTRDRLVHGYFAVTGDVLWKIATDFIPPLAPALRQALGAEIRARDEDGGNG